MCLLTAVLGGGFKENICDTIASFASSTIFYVTAEYNTEKLYRQVLRFQATNIRKTWQGHIKI